MAPDSLDRKIAAELGVHGSQVASVVTLLDDGNTIPFIARYRKEATGGLDEVQLRQIETRLGYLRKLDERKLAVREEIDSQGKLTAELDAALQTAETLQAVEDIYRPYKPKRQTRAAQARERGLEPLAQLLLAQDSQLDPSVVAEAYLSDQVPDVAAALSGARDIVAETVSDDAGTRQRVRTFFAAEGAAVSQRASAEADSEGRYRVYHQFRGTLRSIQPHQWLALRRGASDGSLKTGIETPDAEMIGELERVWIVRPGSRSAAEVSLAVEDGYGRLLRPSIEREVAGQLDDFADEHSIRVFATNLRNLLMQPPLRSRTMMGIDPGFRTGCKVATVDPTGRLLHTLTIFPHPPQSDSARAGAALRDIARKDGVNVIAIGNGTASRETETLVAGLLDELPGVGYVMVSEAGASVYSASDVARAEFPELDVSMRGAVSIARRLQDPLAELVKIDPRSIGVGLYQHDVDQRRLEMALDEVVESVVNHVGVDANTASAHLLAHVSGISRKVAAAIVAHRDANGLYQSRADLKKVKGLGPKAFQQAAGFLRVPESKNLLDNTTVHPESYDVAGKVLAHAKLNLRMADLVGRLRSYCEGLGIGPDGKSGQSDALSRLAAGLGVGEMTLHDILQALLSPGRDPREDLPPVLLRRDVMSLDDLKVGMVLQGMVRNVVDFGAFVDIGVKQDGLLHVSKMGRRFVRNPHEVLGVGDVVEVTVLEVDRARGRISLGMVTT